jgi:hypothetical protein
MQTILDAKVEEWRELQERHTELVMRAIEQKAEHLGVQQQTALWEQECSELKLQIRQMESTLPEGDAEDRSMISVEHDNSASVRVPICKCETKHNPVTIVASCQLPGRGCFILRCEGSVLTNGFDLDFQVEKVRNTFGTASIVYKAPYGQHTQKIAFYGFCCATETNTTINASFLAPSCCFQVEDVVLSAEYCM